MGYRTILRASGLTMGQYEQQNKLVLDYNPNNKISIYVPKLK
jgi:hypothetical protein